MKLPKYVYVIVDGINTQCCESKYDVKEYIDNYGDNPLELTVWTAKVESMTVYRHEHYDQEDED